MDIAEALDVVQVDECDEMIQACEEAGMVQSHHPVGGAFQLKKASLPTSTMNGVLSSIACSSSMRC